MGCLRLWDCGWLVLQSPDAIEILFGLDTHDAFEGCGKVLGVAKAYPIGDVADAQVWILLSQSAGRFYALVTDKGCYILASQST